MNSLQQTPTVITALFLSKRDAKKAEAALRKAGVAPEDIGTGDTTLIEREAVEEKEGFFSRLFHKRHVPDHHRVKYEEHVRGGAVLLAIAVEDAKIDEAVDILNYYGARDFSGAHLQPVTAPRKRSARTRVADNRPKTDEPETVVQPFHSMAPAAAPDLSAPPMSDPAPDDELPGDAAADHGAGRPIGEHGERNATDVEPFSGTPIPQPDETSGTMGDSQDEADLLGEPVPHASSLNMSGRRPEGDPAPIPPADPQETADGWTHMDDVEDHDDIGRRSERRGGVRVYRGIHAGQWEDRELDREFEEHHQQNYSNSDITYGQYAAAYRYGANMAVQPGLQGKSFESAEGDLQRDFESKGIGDEWERVKNAVKFGWDRKRR